MSYRSLNVAGVERIDLETLDFVIERVWVAEPIQGRQPVIGVGRLSDGRWWWSRDDGQRDRAAWACSDELSAERAAHQWSERSRLRWRQAAVPEPIRPRRSSG
jgi:hypothetical protein